MRFLVKVLESCKINSIDDYFGRLDDFYFNLKTGRIEFLILNTGTLFPGKKVMLNPTEVAGFDFVDKVIKVDLTKTQIESLPNKKNLKNETNNCIDLASKKIIYPTSVVSSQELEGYCKKAASINALCSLNHVINFGLETIDKNTTGHVIDFVVDTSSWYITDFIVTTHDWLPGKKISIKYRHLHSINETDRHALFDINRDTLMLLQEFDEKSPVNKNVKIEYLDYTGSTSCHDHMVIASDKI